jgi:hypothetical protein
VRYHVDLTRRPKYLHAAVTGERTVPNTMRFLQEAYEACVSARVKRLLLEMNFSGPALDTLAVYQIISDRSKEGALLSRIAYVEVSPEEEKAAFAETLAINRAVNVRLFRDVATAAAWLEHEEP